MLLTWIRAIETIVEYKPEMTLKMAADLSPWRVWYWASMYISATNLGPFSKEMLIHTSPVSAPSQGQNWLHQSFAAEASPHKGRFVTVVTVIESFFPLLHLFSYHVKYIFNFSSFPHSLPLRFLSLKHGVNLILFPWTHALRIIDF